MTASAPASAFQPLAVRVQLTLDRFNLAIDVTTHQQVTGIFGVSGAGKTSLLETICGLRRGAQGTICCGEEVWLDTANRTCVKPEQRHIGYVPQDGLLFPHKNVRQNLLSGSKRAMQNGHPLQETFELATEILELGSLLDRSVTTLSGGERQRVALGRAICSGPRLLLLDEPFASLDLALRRRLLPFLRRIRSEFQIPMLFVSHDPLEVQAVCDDLIVLKDGRTIAHGEPREVLRQVFTDPNIFSVAEQHGFENILPCRLIENNASTSRVRLGEQHQPHTDSVELTAMKADARPGDLMLASIAANDIIIATHKPEGLSARNIIPARIVQLCSVGPIGFVGLVTAEVADNLPPLTIEITETSFIELGLQVGRQIFLVIKATSFRLYEGERRKSV